MTQKFGLVILFVTQVTPVFEAVNAENDDYLTEATFKINENDIYFSIDVMDENGKRANSQAYYLDELKIKE